LPTPRLDPPVRPSRGFACKLGLPQYPGHRIGAPRLGALPSSRSKS